MTREGTGEISDKRTRDRLAAVATRGRRSRPLVGRGGIPCLPAHPAIPPHRGWTAQDRDDLAGVPLPALPLGRRVPLRRLRRASHRLEGRRARPRRNAPLAGRAAEAGSLELDSASFNHFFIDFLIDLHPDARFVYTRRDAVSWADSFLNMVLRHGTYLQGPSLARVAARARQAHGSQLRSRPVRLSRASPPLAPPARGGVAELLCARDGPHRGRATTRTVVGDPHRGPLHAPRYPRRVRRSTEVGLERGGDHTPTAARARSPSWLRCRICLISSNRTD